MEDSRRTTGTSIVMINLVVPSVVALPTLWWYRNIVLYITLDNILYTSEVTIWGLAQKEVKVAVESHYFVHVFLGGSL